jgi:hypothetical protein
MTWKKNRPEAVVVSSIESVEAPGLTPCRASSATRTTRFLMLAAEPGQLPQTKVSPSPDKGVVLAGNAFDVLCRGHVIVPTLDGRRERADWPK